MVGTLPVAPVQLPIFRNRTYIRFTHLDNSLNEIKCFPDFSNVIDSETLKTHGASYVATQNCYVIGYIKTTGGKSASIYIDGIPVASQLSTSNALYVLLPVAKGSTVSTRNESATEYSLAVYGTK